MKLNEKNIFLLDGVGAALSAVAVGLVLPSIPDHYSTCTCQSPVFQGGEYPLVVGKGYSPEESNASAKMECVRAVNLAVGDYSEVTTDLLSCQTQQME